MTKVELQYRREIKNWIENQVGIYGCCKFSKYRADKYKEALRVYCIRNYRNLEERKEIYFKYIEKIDNQTITSKEF